MNLPTHLTEAARALPIGRDPVTLKAVRRRYKTRKPLPDKLIVRRRKW